MPAQVHSPCLWIAVGSNTCERPRQHELVQFRAEADLDGARFSCWSSRVQVMPVSSEFWIEKLRISHQEVFLTQVTHNKHCVCFVKQKVVCHFVVDFVARHRTAFWSIFHLFHKKPDLLVECNVCPPMLLAWILCVMFATLVVGKKNLHRAMGERMAFLLQDMQFSCDRQLRSQLFLKNDVNRRKKNQKTADSRPRSFGSVWWIPEV